MLKNWDITFDVLFLKCVNNFTSNAFYKKNTLENALFDDIIIAFVYGKK